VKQQQIVLLTVGLCLLVVVYFFGNTIPPARKAAAAADSSTERPIQAEDVILASKSRLSPAQLSSVNRMEHAVVRGDVKTQQLNAYRQLAEFWRDSVKDAFLPSAYYMGEAAKLENSEKSLTFAAQLFLENLRFQANPPVRRWMADEAKGLFERVLRLNPSNDSARIGIGGTYIFGSSASNPQEVMQGVQQILEVAHRDSTNMYAEFMLGLGGIESGQFDKAIDRLNRVVRHEPTNLDAILTLAEAYERKGDKINAVKWYEQSRNLINNPEWNKEIDQRIKLLQ
jgi:tetratricopeptide (TPR) repeat protein